MSRANGVPDTALPLTGLVIGYGSIGRRHARALNPLVQSLIIVNRRESVRVRAGSEHPRARVVSSLDALSADAPLSDVVAVIATWGPSHAELFHALADRGVRRILCEKAMATCVRDARTMAQRAEREGIFLSVNHTIRYAGLAAALRHFAQQHELGDPVAVMVEGGAACLITNGIHWIDFASELFGAAPKSVISTAHGEAINPRSPTLMLYGGTAVWSFGGHREAVISFSNRSSIRHHARIYYRDAVVAAGFANVNGDEHIRIEARHRDRSAVAQCPAITRTGPTPELLFDGCLPTVRSFNEGLSASAQELVAGEIPTCSGDVGATAVSACIGALIAAREGREVDLPVSPTEPWGGEQWPVS